MPSSAGLDRITGASLTGWEHVRQSIAVILTTPIGSRVMRREFGSEVMDLIDRPMTDRVIIAVYVATANALIKWEPRFKLTRCEIVQAKADGSLFLELGGIYYPRGHLGDFTPANDTASAVVVLGRVAA